MVSEVDAVVEFASLNARKHGLGLSSGPGIHQPSIVEVSVELVELASGVKASCTGRCPLLAPRGSLLFKALADFHLLFERLF